PSSDSLSFVMVPSSVLYAGTVRRSSQTSCPLPPAPVARDSRVPLWFFPRRSARHQSSPVRLPNRRQRWALWARSLARERGDGPVAERMGNGTAARRCLLASRRRRSTQHPLQSNGRAGRGPRELRALARRKLGLGRGSRPRARSLQHITAAPPLKTRCP